MMAESKLSVYVMTVVFGLLYQITTSAMGLFDSAEFTIICGIVSTIVGTMFHWNKVPSIRLRVSFGLASLFVPILGLKLVLWMMPSAFPIVAHLAFGFGLIAFSIVKFLLEQGESIVNRLGWAGVKRVEKTIGGDDNDK